MMEIRGQHGMLKHIYIYTGQLAQNPILTLSSY